MIRTKNLLSWIWATFVIKTMFVAFGEANPLASSLAYAHIITFDGNSEHILCYTLLDFNTNAHCS